MKTLRRGALALALALFALALGAYVGRGWIATAVAHRLLADRGVACRELSIGLGWRFESASVARARCRPGAGQVSEVAVPAGLAVELDGLTPARLRATTVVVDLRDGPATSGLLGAFLGGDVAMPMRRQIDRLAELARREDLPVVDIEQIDLRRAGQPLRVRQAHLERHGGAVSLRLASVAPPPRERGPLRIAGRLLDVEASARPDRVEVRGTLDLDLAAGRRLQLDQALPFVLTGEGLDGDRPRYHLELARSPELDGILARLSTLQESLRAWRRGAADRRAGRAARRRARRERLEGLVERARERLGGEATPEP